MFSFVTETGFKRRQHHLLLTFKKKLIFFQVPLAFDSIQV